MASTASVQVDIHVERLVEEVFAFVTDPSTHSRWQADLELDRFEDGIGDVGSRGLEVRRFMGRTITTRYEVIHYEPPTRWVLRTLDGPVKATTTIETLPAHGGTDLRMRLEFDGWAGGVVARHSQTRVVEHLQRLKELLEGREGTSARVNRTRLVP